MDPISDNLEKAARERMKTASESFAKAPGDVRAVFEATFATWTLVEAVLAELRAQNRS